MACFDVKIFGFKTSKTYSLTVKKLSWSRVYATSCMLLQVNGKDMICEQIQSAQRK